MKMTGKVLEKLLKEFMIQDNKIDENIFNQNLLQEKNFLIEQKNKINNIIKNKIKIKENIYNLQLKNNVDFLKKTNFSLTEKNKKNKIGPNTNFIFNIFYNNYIYNNNYHNNSINFKSENNVEKLSFCTVNDFSSYFKLNDLKNDSNRLSFNKTINKNNKKIKNYQIRRLFLNSEKKSFNYNIQDFDYNKLFSMRNNYKEIYKSNKNKEKAKKKILEVYEDYYVYHQKQILHKKRYSVQNRYKNYNNYQK